MRRRIILTLPIPPDNPCPVCGHTLTQTAMWTRTSKNTAKKIFVWGCDHCEVPSFDTDNFGNPISSFGSF